MEFEEGSLEELTIRSLEEVNKNLWIPLEVDYGKFNYFGKIKRNRTYQDVQYLSIYNLDSGERFHSLLRIIYLKPGDFYGNINPFKTPFSFERLFKISPMTMFCFPLVDLSPESPSIGSSSLKYLRINDKNEIEDDNLFNVKDLVNGYKRGVDCDYKTTIYNPTEFDQVAGFMNLPKN